jgi:glycosyltransferase involved in cell wall biosynthesis
MSRVSVVIPAYNAERFVSESINSALAQTHSDVEVIVVDDSSTDGTARVLERYGSEIRVHRQPNAGAATARNAGASLATGEWLAFLDADDLWERTKLERQLADSAAAAWAYSNRTNFGSRGDVPVLQSDVTAMHDGDVFIQLLSENFITSSSVLIRRELFRQLGGFNTQLRNAEDWDLWLRVAERHPIAYCAEPLVRYRFHSGGKSRNHRAMAVARRAIIARALDLPRGRQLPWTLRRRIWSETWRTNGWDADQAGARADALRHYAKAVVAWPLALQPFKGALKVCLDV